MRQQTAQVNGTVWIKNSVCLSEFTQDDEEKNVCVQLSQVSLTECDSTLLLNHSNNACWYNIKKLSMVKAKKYDLNIFLSIILLSLDNKFLQFSLDFIKLNCYQLLENNTEKVVKCLCKVSIELYILSHEHKRKFL